MRAWPAAVCLAGLTLATFGIWVIYWPATIVFAGIVIAGAALDLGR